MFCYAWNPNGLRFSSTKNFLYGNENFRRPRNDAFTPRGSNCSRGAKFEDYHELIALRANIADEVVISFAEQKEDDMHSSFGLQPHFSSGAAMLSKVIAKLARERQNLTRGVVRFANDLGVFAESAICTRRVLMDSYSQLVMIGIDPTRRCVEIDDFKLGTMPIYHLDLFRGTEQAIAQTKTPLHLIFRVGAWPTYSQFFLKCAVTAPPITIC